MKTPVATLILALLLALPARAAQELTVVELFTSQGCSSCPPADRFLNELADKPGLLALSFHVDYWDYIGWKDPFASPEHTRRQRTYSKYMGLRGVYTPQIVVQGRTHMTGSDRRRVTKAIHEAAKGDILAVDLSQAPDGAVTVRLPRSDKPEPATVWLVTFDREHATKVRRGENRGREIKNANVVRSLADIGEWTGEAAELQAKVEPNGADGCAVIVQAKGDGRVLGGAKMGLR